MVGGGSHGGGAVAVRMNGERDPVGLEGVGGLGDRGLGFWVQFLLQSSLE